MFQTLKGEAPMRQPSPITQTMTVFRKWLLLKDATSIYALFGAVAANYLPGDPVWLGIIGPPSSAKTELLNSVSRLPNIHAVATVTEGGLLSGVPKKDRSGDSKGGLLREIGKFGIIACKDLGSVISMPNETRARVLAALRELYDGAWTRHLGSDGGRTLHWEGKLGFVFAATGAIDLHHIVIGDLGDRWLMSRLDPVKKGQLAVALKHDGATAKLMRDELAEAVKRLFAGRNPNPPQLNESDPEFIDIDRAVSLMVRLRGSVKRDRFSREVEIVLGTEGTARPGLALVGIFTGLQSLGVDRADALKVIRSIALDSVPPIRRNAYDAVCKYDPALNRQRKDGPAETSDIAIELGLPTGTVRRALEELVAHGLIRREKQGKSNTDLWMKCPWEQEK
jgi:DNA-binding transcriptional ArsR family regulator